MLPFKKLPFKIENIWLTSDTHGFHKNICKGTTSWGEGHKDGCRDFNTLEEMNEDLIKNINKDVKHDNLLIHCGDWTFGGEENVKKFRDRINCRNIILLQGNHDHRMDKYIEVGTMNEMFQDFLQIGYFQSQGERFVCCHFPMSIWYQSHHEVPLFYGHVHGSFQNVGKSMDVGVDNIFKLKGSYSPISLKEALEITRKKSTFLESHHQKETN
jgi:calcineurin-like phosphoesterase family protein